MSAPFHRVSSLRYTRRIYATPTDSRGSQPTESHQKTSAEQEYRRRQAIELYPFLEALQHLHSTPAHHSANSLAAQLTRPQRRALWHAIDHGLPLAGILAQELKLAPWMIKHLQHHWPEYHDHDRRYGHKGWDIRALLESWTPETAPRTTKELERLSSLTGFDHYKVLPFFHCTQAPLRSRDRHLLCQLLRDEAQYRRFQRYMVFLNMLSAWIEQHTGDPIAARLQQLLGVTTVTDWWTLCNRWHRINAELCQSLAITMKWAPPSDPLTHFGLFDEPITIGEYTFTSLNNRLDLKSEADRMNNCVEAYLGQCAFLQLCLIHVARLGAPAATLSVVRASDTSSFRIAVDRAEGPRRAPLTTLCSAAIERFVDGINAGIMPTRAQALHLQPSRDALIASLFEAQPCIDYPSWCEQMDQVDDSHYFDQHARRSGTRAFEIYRDALEKRQSMIDSLYQRAIKAGFGYRE
jgi:hypothetical protein